LVDLIERGRVKIALAAFRANFGVDVFDEV
jgi:hypothetical protein